MSKRTFPWTDKVGGQEITFTILKPSEQEELLAFGKSLSKDDMMYLRMDISQPESIEDWIENVQRGRTITVLARDEDDGIVGYGSLHMNARLWTSHIGEIRVFVVKELRGIGLASRLVTEIFQIGREQKLDRLVFNISREQPHMQRMLEKLGFHVEALLTDWLRSRDGRTHDLLIMSHHVDE
jgi:RimJ/RimL family protein N-acetyltransferase